MSAPQYEPCEHRPEREMPGVHVDYYNTPCPDCEAAEDDDGYIVIAVVCVLAVLAMVVGITS